MKTTIERLYRGELSPWSDRSSKEETVRELSRLLDRQEAELTSRLDKEGSEWLEKYRETTSELVDIELTEAFIRGFSLGMKLFGEATYGKE